MRTSNFICSSAAREHEHDGRAHETHARDDGHDHHEHDDSVSSVGIEVDADVDLDALETWLGELHRADTAKLFRMKSILFMQRYALQDAHGVIELRATQAWGVRAALGAPVYAIVPVLTMVVVMIVQMVE